MIRDEEFLLLVSDSTHIILRVESLLKDNGIKARIIPLPGELKASCGLSVKCGLENLEEIRVILERAEVVIEGYKVEKKGLKKNYIELF